MTLGGVSDLGGPWPARADPALQLLLQNRALADLLHPPLRLGRRRRARARRPVRALSRAVGSNRAPGVRDIGDVGRAGLEGRDRLRSRSAAPRAVRLSWRCQKKLGALRQGVPCVSCAHLQCRRMNSACPTASGRGHAAKATPRHPAEAAPSWIQLGLAQLSRASETRCGLTRCQSAKVALHVGAACPAKICRCALDPVDA